MSHTQTPKTSTDNQRFNKKIASAIESLANKLNCCPVILAQTASIDALKYMIINTDQINRATSTLQLNLDDIIKLHTTDRDTFTIEDIEFLLNDTGQELKYHSLLSPHYGQLFAPPKKQQQTDVDTQAGKRIFYAQNNHK